jgi:hypothetical protein
VNYEDLIKVVVVGASEVVRLVPMGVGMPSQTLQQHVVKTSLWEFLFLWSRSRFWSWWTEFVNEKLQNYAKGNFIRTPLSHCPQSMGEECLKVIVYVQNRVIHKGERSSTPFGLLFGMKPNVSFARRIQHQRKLDDKLQREDSLEKMTMQQQKEFIFLMKEK